MSFTVGTDATFTVTTLGGYPGEPAVSVTAGTLPAGVQFADNGNGTGTLHGTAGFGTGGTYPLTITADPIGSAPSVTHSFTLTVLEPSTITSANHATFAVGASGSFTVTTAGGEPGSPITFSAPAADLPPGMALHDLGNGSATIDGVPTSGGVFTFTITASNGVLPARTQRFTATVTQAPSITSADGTTFAAGAAGSFTVTTEPGTPVATQVRATGTDLAALGLTFTPDDATGTAVLSGIAPAGSGGTYSFTVTASNAVASSSQTFTLTITELPTVSSADTATFTVGTGGSVDVSTVAGFPTATTVREVSGNLPAWLVFTADDGTGTATLAGTPPAGSGGTILLSFRAANTAGGTTQAFTLTVDESPAFTSAAQVTFTAGSSQTYTVGSTGGVPTPTLSMDAALLPAGVTFTDQGDGTAILSGTALSGGVFTFTITASNGVTTDATQDFTLTVNGPPGITSASSATFTAGVPGSFSVTARDGVPAGTTLTEAGPLPAGVTFEQQFAPFARAAVAVVDTTATLSGTARATAAGTYPITITASNGVDPDTVQRFVLTVTTAGAVVLPPEAPSSNGALGGVPDPSSPAQIITVTGSGCASGAAVTVGSYPLRTALGQGVADDAGQFSLRITLTGQLGTHTIVAACVGPDGLARVLTANTTTTTAATTTPLTPTPTPTLTTLPTTPVVPAPYPTQVPASTHCAASA